MLGNFSHKSTKGARIVSVTWAPLPPAGGVPAPIVAPHLMRGLALLVFCGCQRGRNGKGFLVSARNCEGIAGPRIKCGATMGFVFYNKFLDTFKMFDWPSRCPAVGDSQNSDGPALPRSAANRGTELPRAANPLAHFPSWWNHLLARKMSKINMLVHFLPQNRTHFCGKWTRPCPDVVFTG
jgi:hypothetical protein